MVTVEPIKQLFSRSVIGLLGARCKTIMRKHALKRNRLLEYAARSLYMWEFAHLEVSHSLVEKKTIKCRGVGSIYLVY